MADQGLPLMALPQQNLFGAAGDDLAHQLANREIAKRKQMLEDIDTQLKIQKGNAEADKIGSDIATASSTRRINEAKAPVDLAHVGAETEGLNLANTDKKTAQADKIKLGEAMDNWTTVLQNPNATEQDQLAAGMQVYKHGGKIDPEVIKQIGAINEKHAQGILMDNYEKAVRSGNQQDILIAGTRLMTGGGKGVPTQDSTPFITASPGSTIVDARTGHQTGTVPGSPGALAGDQGANTIQGYKDLLRHGAQISAIPAAARNAVVADMAQKGETFETLTMQGRAMTDLAKSLVPKIDTLRNTWAQIQAMDMTGTIRGRLRQVAAGESLASAMAGLTPEQQRVLSRFESEVSFFTSGTTRAHFQRAGAETYAIMDKNLNPAGSSYESYLGKLDAANEYLGTYANMGGLHEPGEQLLTPGAGAGKGGGAGVPPASGQVGSGYDPYGLLPPKPAPKGPGG